MSALDFLEQELAALAEQSRLRTTPDAKSAAAARTLCSNDYLGFAAFPLALGQRGGSGASALVSGYGMEHAHAEQALSGWLQAEAVLMFSSGYAANVGIVPALVGRGDAVFSDALNHASLIDGARLSGASVHVFPHLDAASLERELAATSGRYRRRLVLTESYFSMDGDCADLRRLRACTERAGAILMVDEAHALGVFGPAGRGLCAAAGVTPDVLVGTLGKSLGLQGAFAVGSNALRAWLWNRARSFVFSTASSPAIAATVPDRVARVAGAEVERAWLLAASERVRGVLLEAGAVVPVGSTGPIVPWVLGSETRALAASEDLLGAGFLVKAIRPPTVPEAGSRLRLTLDAALGRKELETLLEVLSSIAKRHRFT
jgi:8-amino-7-oxononanoate synthase